MGYSIAIRTLGRAGEKYRKLLDSIGKSKIQPDKVIVVLPKGARIPKEKLGWEQFVFCEKSMIQQRIEALKYIDSDYTLFLDDDISFDENFVEKLIKPLKDNTYECSTGPLFSFFPASTLGRIAGTLTASVSVSLFNRDKYVKILRSGGWSYHTFDTSVEKYYPTESFAWTCFMIKTDVMRKLNMQDEKKWLERFGYAAGDDRVMAYKLIKIGYKACVVSNATYAHNDAKTSTSEEEMVNTKPTFCMAFMHTVFWQRFIQDMDKKSTSRFLNKICFCYWHRMMLLYHTVKSLNPANAPFKEAFIEGVNEGKKYIDSREYMDLPAVV